MIQSERCICDKMTPSEPSDTVARVPNCGVKLTWHVVGSVVLPCIAIYTSILQNALADLPIHATPSDIHGLWLFSLSPPIRGTVHSCGSTTPNKNSSNLRPELQDYKSFLETHGGVHKEIRLHLSDRPVPFSVARRDAAARGVNRQSWKALGVFDGENLDALVGSWTTVYDEGFEVFVGGNTRMMGYMKYSQDPACDAVPRDGDLEDNTGNTRCYITDARRTHMGWYNQDRGKGEFSSGCFYAERLDSPAESAGSAFVMVQEAQTPESVSFLSATQALLPSSGQQEKQAPPDLAYYVSQEFVDSHNASPTSSWRAGLNPVFAHADGATLSKYIKNFGVKKIYRGNSGKYQAAHSFMQSGVSLASEGSSANQLYACPCKKGERPLDTRTDKSGASIPVLSPLSALEFGERKTFLASIAPHAKSSSSVGKEEEKLNLNSRNPVEAVVHVHHPVGANRKEPDTHTAPLASLEISTEELPANFSWSDPFSAAAFDEEVINQGSCGSCYAVAATYALQKRFEIAASKMLGRDVKLFGQSLVNSEVPLKNHVTSFMDLRNEIGAQGNLSAQSVLSCSFYNQGCDGGFPYLVGKHARDIGIPQENCMSYQATDKARCPLQSNLSSLDGEQQTALPSLAGSLMETESQACVSNARWFANDYGYVGACYECNQCSGERMIMEEVYQNGPVAAALEAPQSLFSYDSGIFDVDPSHEHHSRVCDMNSAMCKGLLTGWEFTNHAVAIVGWGEESSKDDASTGPQKYWIVRNTWGPLWGKKGYVKIARGKNLGGIESQTTWIDPDFTRGMGREVAQKIEALRKTAVESA